MTDILNALKKSRKASLPLGWVERFSKKHPDRPFYFNESTGECRWSAPLDSEENKVMGSPQQKGKKRKTVDVENEEAGDTTADSTASSKLLDAISNRPKLKAKGPKAAAEAAKASSNNDTPAMRLYREKLAQRKAVLEAKKSTPKAANKKQNQTVSSPRVCKVSPSPSASKLTPSRSIPKVTPPPSVPKVTPPPSVSKVSSPPSVSLRLQRRTRASSVISTNESVSSTCSTISNASSMGTKIKSAAVPIGKTPTKANESSEKDTVNKLPKIPKVQLVKTTVASSNINLSDCETLSDTSTNQNLVNVSNVLDATKLIKKNTASERMQNFRKSLSLERDKNSPVKRLRQLSPIINNKSNSSQDKKNRVQKSGLLEIHKSKQFKKEEEIVKNKRILEKIEVTDVYCEQMEWEPIEDEKIMSEVQSVRFQLCENPMEKLSEFSCNALQSLDTVAEKHALYIVIDTNVFLSNLPFVEEVRDSHSDIFGRPFIVIPWTVLQELDFIKDDKNSIKSQMLKLKARKAIEFLNRHFNTKHPRFLGQTPQDVERNKKKYMIECPDDEILQTCLQIKESIKSPVLLSYDKNLCNKAMIHDIPILGRNDPLEKIYYLKAAETTEFLSNSLHTRIEEKQEDISSAQKELLTADDILEEGKAVLKSVLSKVVEFEMENLFGGRWEMHVIIRPPWSVVTVLKCALKHWMAAVNESFIRKTEPMLRDILLCINNAPDGGRKLQDVKFFLDKCNDIVQTLNATKYPDLKAQTLKNIEDLIKRCLQATNDINNARFKESIGSENDECEEERRATLAFKVLEDIYAFARDACGIAADALGLQCAFAFNKLHPFITTEYALLQQQEIGVNVNKLLQALRMSLSKMDEGIHPNDKVIYALYEALVNFSSDLNFDELTMMAPLDLFCCIKLKKTKLEKGYEQLQELAIHFCRMANYQCK